MENNEEKKEIVKEEVGVKTLLEQLVKQNETMVKEKKVKKWKIPFKGRVNNGQAKKGWATIQILRHNGTVDFVKGQVENDGTVIVDGFPRDARVDYKLTYNGKPYYIIPEWSMKPISPMENRQQGEIENMNISGRLLVLARMQKEVIKPKGKLPGGIGWILLIVGGVIAAYYFMGGKLF